MSRVTKEQRAELRRLLSDHWTRGISARWAAVLDDLDAAERVIDALRLGHEGEDFREDCEGCVAIAAYDVSAKGGRE